MILRPTTCPEDWRVFLAQPELHWKPGRSAMKTAHSWEGAQGVPQEIAALFGPAPQPGVVQNRGLPGGKTLLLGWTTCPLQTEGLPS